MENSSYTIGNRSRDLPVFSAIPQPLRHRVAKPALRDWLLLLLLSSLLTAIWLSFGGSTDKTSKETYT
jgi:hypothetical protein